MPVHRNGWMLLAAYVAIMFSLPKILTQIYGYEPGFPIRLVVVGALSVAFGYVAMKKTEDGWGKRPER